MGRFQKKASPEGRKIQGHLSGYLGRFIDLLKEAKLTPVEIRSMQVAVSLSDTNDSPTSRRLTALLTAQESAPPIQEILEL